MLFRDLQNENITRNINIPFFLRHRRKMSGVLGLEDCCDWNKEENIPGASVHSRYAIRFADDFLELYPIRDIAPITQLRPKLACSGLDIYDA